MKGTMAAQGTTQEVLNEMRFSGLDLIQVILYREEQEGCEPAPGAYQRIKEALIEAVNREVTCTT